MDDLMIKYVNVILIYNLIFKPSSYNINFNEFKS